MLGLFFWPVIIILAMVGLIVSFPEKALEILTNLKRQLYKRLARRYGQDATDHHFSLHFWEHRQPEPQATPTLEYLYASQYGYFFRYFLGLEPPVVGLTISKRAALRLFVIGFLIRWGLAKIRSTRT